MGTSEKRINTCAGGTGAAGDWESAKPEGLFLAVLPYVSWQRAKDVAIRERSFSVSIYDAGDSEFVAVWLGCVGPGVPFVLEPGPTGWR